MERFFVRLSIRLLLVTTFLFFPNQLIAKCRYDSGFGIFHAKGLEGRIPTGEYSGEYKEYSGSVEVHTDTHSVATFSSVSCYVYDPWKVYVRLGYLSHLDVSVYGETHLSYQGKNYKASIDTNAIISGSISGPMLGVGKDFLYDPLSIGLEVGVMRGRGVMRVSGDASGTISVASRYNKYGLGDYLGTYSGNYSGSYAEVKKGNLLIARGTIRYSFNNKFGVSLVHDMYARNYQATYLVLSVVK